MQSKTTRKIIAIVLLSLAIFVSLKSTLNNQALKILRKKTDQLETRLRSDITPKVDVSFEAVLDLIGDANSLEFWIDDHLYVFSRGSIYLVNETSIAEKFAFAFDPAAKTLPNKSFNSQRILVVEPSKNSTTLIAMTSPNKPLSVSYQLNSPEMDQILTINNLLIGINNGDIYLTTLEQNKFRKFGRLSMPDERIVKLIKTDVLYYIFTNCGLYFIDSYNLILRHVDSFAETVSDAAYLIIDTHRYFVTVSNQKMVIFHKWVNKFDFEKDKQIPFDSSEVLLIDDYVVVNQRAEIRLYSLKSLIIEEADEFSIVKIEKQQRVLGIRATQKNLKVSTFSREYGLITYAIQLSKSIEEPGIFDSLFAKASDQKLLLILMVPVGICVFAFLKTKQTEIKEDVRNEERKKSQIDILMRAHKKRVEEIGSRVSTLSERVNKLAGDSGEGQSKQVSASELR